MDPIATKITQAADMLRQGKLTTAAKLCDDVLKRAPGQPVALSLKGLAAYMRGEHAQAVRLFDQSLAKDPNNGATLANRGNALQALGRHEQALDSFRRSLEVGNPNPAGCLYNMGNALSDLGRHEAAVAAYRQSLAMRPGHDWTTNNLALALKEAGGRAGVDEAVALYRRLRAAQPGFPGIDWSLAQAVHAQVRLMLDAGEAAHALAAAEEVEALVPGGGARLELAARAPSLWRPSGAMALEWWADCLVLPGDKEWFVRDASGAIHLDGMANTNPEVSPYVRVLGQSHAVVTQVDPELEVKAAVLLGGSRNHYHWLVDYLPRLERLLAERELWGGAKLLVNAGLTAGQRDSLRLLGIGQDELLPVPDGTAVRAGRLLVTPVGTHAGKPRLETLAWLRAAFGIAGAPSGRRLYVSRSDASVRRVVNEAELVPALRKLGFEVVVPGRLSFEQQVAAFAGASVIVGPHGAGLTNMVFAPPGARVVELIAGRTPMVFFDALAESCGHAFRRLVCPSAQSPDARHEARVENHDMAAPVAELVALLKAL